MSATRGPDDRPAPGPTPTPGGSPTGAIELVVDGAQVAVPAGAGTLLDALRDHLGVTSVKDGCSPQGQCGCCTVLVDGKPRVSCVTPLRRVAGRRVTTLDGLDPARRDAWAEAFCATGASQCGFCTPGIIVRLAALVTDRAAGEPIDRAAVDQALLAHLCRCTGWQTIHEAVVHLQGGATGPTPATTDSAAGSTPAGEAGLGRPVARDLDAAARRAELEGGAAQRVGPEIALGHGGFAADSVPADALVAVPDGADGWALGETTAEARRAAGKVQGRRTTVGHTWPLEVPDGDWAATVRTTWVEPAYLETDASWCAPGGEPAPIAANGGAFGAKASSPVSAAARRLADETGRPVLALASREDATRWGPKRPPVAGGVGPDGRGRLRVVRTPGIADAIRAVAPELVVEEVEVAGPPTSAAIRAAGWAEAVLLLAGARGEAGTVEAPNGAQATAEVTSDRIQVAVRCGEAIDPTVLRSYCIGAAHMAWSWLSSEALTVDGDGDVVDLTIRSFGILRAADMPTVEVDIEVASSLGPAVNGSDAVFAAVAAAGWLALGTPRDLPHQGAAELGYGR